MMQQSDQPTYIYQWYEFQVEIRIQRTVVQLNCIELTVGSIMRFYDLHSTINSTPLKFRKSSLKFTTYSFQQQQQRIHLSSHFRSLSKSSRQSPDQYTYTSLAIEVLNSSEHLMHAHLNHSKHSDSYGSFICFHHIVFIYWISLFLLLIYILQKYIRFRIISCQRSSI